MGFRTELIIAIILTFFNQVFEHFHTFLHRFLTPKLTHFGLSFETSDFTLASEQSLYLGAVIENGLSKMASKLASKIDSFWCHFCIIFLCFLCHLGDLFLCFLTFLNAQLNIHQFYICKFKILNAQHVKNETHVSQIM